MAVCDRWTNKRPCGEWVVDVRVPTRSTGSPSQYTANIRTYDIVVLLETTCGATWERRCWYKAAARNRRQPSGASLLVPKLCVLSAVARSFSYALETNLWRFIRLSYAQGCPLATRPPIRIFIAQTGPHFTLWRVAAPRVYIEMWAGRLVRTTRKENKEALFVDVSYGGVWLSNIKYFMVKTIEDILN